ncbi:MAG: hypothetical protein JWQ30_786 [Sediminibacterium sp.]|nr:hypothetical protein [Sediminibacterium sp.]
MKNEDVESLLNRIQIPEPENIIQHSDLKIPLLSYKKSSKAGLWLLPVPLTVAVIVVLKTVFGLQSDYIKRVREFFAAIDKNDVLTFLIPIIFVLLPLIVMVMNLLAFCHFQRNKKTKELVVTVKYRIFNIVLFFISFAILLFFLTPDNLSFR